ncbi:MAG: GAF domain-containing protein [Alphaproteobacteria bacterium]|nr:GAF domain-containing protein [Alphaproteobacteria bacterium]NNF23550.1 GAF domain-containing protein [Paracoccaceae bacterium]
MTQDPTLLDTPAEAPFDNLTRLASALVGAPVSLISILDFENDRQFFKSMTGLEGPFAEARQTPLSHSFCQYVVGQNAPLVVTDAPNDPRVNDNLAIEDLDVVGYLGVPIHDPQDQPVGALCVIEPAPRAWSEQDLHYMKMLGACVTDAIRARNALRLASSLRDSEAMRNELREFTYAISHDLKSPANTMALLLSEIKHALPADQLPEDVADFLNMADETVERMRDLIEDILQFTRTIEAEPELQQVDLASLADEVCAALGTPLRESGAQLQVHPLPPVMGSETQLRILLQNLLDNAIKFRAEGRPATISITAEPGADGRRRLSVTDNGIGIAEEDFERVQKLFQRLHLRTEIPGSGIGLALCRRIAENHGAELILSSEIGRGTTASVDLYGVI